MNSTSQSTQVMVIPRLPSPYMPPWSGIGQWCRSLGQSRMEWQAVMSIYCDGNGGPLFCVRKLPPFFRFNETSDWKLLKQWNPQRDPDVSKDTLSEGVSIKFHGWMEKDAYVTIQRKEESVFTYIPRLHLLHVVSTASGLKSALECRPLPMQFFVQALARP